MRPRIDAVTATIACSLLALLPGCGPQGSPAEPPKLVPASGTITVDGEPLAGAVVTFLQTDEFGTTAHGQTDEQGEYELQAMMMSGIAPGTYKVSVSYLMPPSGEPVSLSAQGSLVPSEEVYDAKELVPDKYSDLGVTELEVTVPPEGGTFDLDLEGPLLDPPAPIEDEPAAEETSEAEAEAEPAEEETVPPSDEPGGEDS